MRHCRIIVGVGLLLLLALNVSASEPTQSYSLWLGGTYIDTTYYGNKVGEYRWYEDDFTPEIGLNYKSFSDNSAFFFDANYYNKENMEAKLTSTMSDRLKMKFDFNSFRRHTGQDLLENIETREAGGGKILTHELLDEGADYKYQRRQVLTEFSALLSRQNDVRVRLAHRAILRDGNEQSVSNSHCFSCHLVSREAKVKDQMHDLQAGIEGDMGRLRVGYDFGYRLYESDAPTPYNVYDNAEHPVFGTADAEFGSRLNFEDAKLPVDQKPKTEKMSHKVRVKGDAGKGKFASAFSYTRAENKVTELAAKSWAGTFNYAVPTSPNGRLIAKVAVTGMDADDPFVDVNSHREGLLGEVTDFDFTRYSALDRSTAKLTAEYIHRMNRKLTLSLLGGFDRVARTDYPLMDDGVTSTTMTGQAKIRYRKGLKYSSNLRLKYEKTSDPFVSGRGLFEAVGHNNPDIGVLDPFSNFIFYWQREDLRYQNITTEPTDLMEADWRMSYRPNGKTSLNFSANYTFDKNGDLDSLDVEHSKIRANASFTLMPNIKWTVTGGVGYSMNSSRGPVTVALFDG